MPTRYTMKPIYKNLILLFTVCSIHVSSQNVFTSLDSALVACYPFSGNANDQSANGLNGTVNNAVLVSDRFGNANSAYSFGGPTNTANIVVPGFSSYLNGTGVSLSFWTAKSSYAYDCAFLMTTDISTNRFSLSVYYGSSGSPANYWDYGDISSNGRLVMTSFSSLPASGTWDHWVFTSSSLGMKAYKNGVLVASKTSASVFSTNPTRNLCIGGAVGLNGGILWYLGSLDDIRIYKRELLASEVTKLYSGNFSCICPSITTPTSATNVSGLCFGASATLSAVSSTSLQWYGSSSSTLSLGGGTSYAISSSVAPGSYTCYARASDGCSTSSPLAITYTINPFPILQTTVSGSTLCAGQTAVFQATGAVNYTWMPGNLQTANINASPLSSTTYTLMGESNGCVSTKTLGMTVINLPPVSIAASAPAVCEGKTVTLIGSGATSYTWQPGNINTATVTILPPTTTVYTLTGLSSGCTNTAVITIPVANLPTVSISGSSVICLGKNALLLATGATNYTWLPGNIQSQILSISPTANTIYTVTGETSGCTNTAAIAMTVVNPPTISIAASATSICPGSQVSFTASGATNYTWSSGITNPILNLSPAGGANYTVTGIDVNNCSGTAVASVFVHSVSIIGVVSNVSGSICAGEQINLIASGAGSYTWNNGAQSSTLTLNPSITTTLTVTGSDLGNGCLTTQTYVQNVDECAGIKTYAGANMLFDIYPNPNTGIFTLLTNSGGEVMIYNAIGEIVYNRKHSGSSEINLENLNNGVYIISVLVDQQKLTRRFIKQ